MSAANLQERLPIRNERDELGHLARAFNDLLDRRDQALERQRRFIADASHELRTPVAILCGEAEVALSQTNEFRGVSGIIAGTQRGITAHKEHRGGPIHSGARGCWSISSNALGLLPGRIGGRLRANRPYVAQAKGISLQCEGPLEMPIRGDEALIRRLILKCSTTRSNSHRQAAPSR